MDEPSIANMNQSSSIPPSKSQDPTTPSSNFTPSSLNYYHPSPSRTIYSDRFIPCRSASNFALFDISPPPPPPPADASRGEDNPSSSAAYTALLRTALFGSDLGFLVPPGTPDKKSFPVTNSPASQNIFRFKSETRQSLHSLSPFGFDDQLPGVSHSPVKAPRKVPRSPYKVLDAPALQDDFYLNLVDWSSHNVLAVGLGNCVYLWNACSSKVTKLCDLGIDDSVCSVGWAQRGTSLALATLTGHTYRVLYLAISPDGQTIVTGAGDETLRFWNVFPSPKSQNTESEIGASSFGRTHIR
ncbi:Quinonprotein alcohol dehydrogenase-like-superfamily [Cynara cardunculus var. scolymus]|uniref:Quinonprotein alcohol dehydrogenase-like-superfamily n=1 Tax=Cynara cardunculus var. scolymus TaxID=59895 RepID=A0A103XJB7_CYNCS|nr:Quinonprotein alcohol dehydrogenase-like-superfamily [Cynara cardunculus var. scolymus]